MASCLLLLPLLLSILLPLLLLIISTPTDRLLTPPNTKTQQQVLTLRLTHREINTKTSVLHSAVRDLHRIETLQTRSYYKNKRNPSKRNLSQQNPPNTTTLPGNPMATLKSGASMGSGEYFIDVFIGTPPLHFSMILDTGSDLNWIQCTPCISCFDQKGPLYDPSLSSSFKNITCSDPRCSMVSSPYHHPCTQQNQTCPYFYYYGDSSNTTGDFSLETFTLNISQQTCKNLKVEQVMLGCGRYNRGLFQGAAGLLGLGRGPLSFSSHLQSLYGRSFSYCLVKRNSTSDTTSRLVFGPEYHHPLLKTDMNFTTFAPFSQRETFYYLQIKSVAVGGEVLQIPDGVWSGDYYKNVGGGAIVDSGTTLSYFPEPAFSEIKKAFVEKTKGLSLVEDAPILYPCYNISGVVVRNQFPSFEIRFRDGGVWSFPFDNYFIEIEEGEISCLAILRTPHSGLSILGNYQQQNFKVVYDTENSRLGFAPADCSRLSSQ